MSVMEVDNSEMEYKKMSQQYFKDNSRLFPWIEYDPEFEFARIVGCNPSWMLPINDNNLENENKLYDIYVMKIQEIIKIQDIPEEMEMLAAISELETDYNLLTAYDNSYYAWDKFSGEWSKNKSYGRKLKSSDLIYIYKINPIIKEENTRRSIVDRIIINEEIDGNPLYKILSDKDYHRMNEEYKRLSGKDYIDTENAIDTKNELTPYNQGFLQAYVNNKIDSMISIKPFNCKNFLEKDLEDYVEKHIHKLESGMKVIDRQFEIKNGYIDILAEDKDGVKCIIELKIVKDCKDIIFQSAYYPTQFNEKVRMITICPDYANKIDAALTSLGYVEMKKYYFKGNEIFIEDYIK